MFKRSCVFFFFFSSRRRHTRSLRDWSSDVCSSDLAVGVVLDPRPRDARGAHPPAGLVQGHAEAGRRRAPRSEERRVGKECRSRGWPDHEKKKKEEKIRQENET